MPQYTNPHREGSGGSASDGGGGPSSLQAMNRTQFSMRQINLAAEAMAANAEAAEEEGGAAKRRGALSDGPAWFWLTYRHLGRKMRLVLQADHADDAAAWQQALRIVTMLKPNPLPGTRHKQWMIDVFQAADKDGSGFVERHELLLMLSACNKTMRPEWIEARMRLIGEEGTSRLSFSQVARLLEAALVDNPALTELFKRYAVAHKTYRPPGGGRAPPFLTLEEFITFGVEVQGEVRGPEWERLAAMQFEAARTGANLNRYRSKRRRRPRPSAACARRRRAARRPAARRRRRFGDAGGARCRGSPSRSSS